MKQRTAPGEDSALNKNEQRKLDTLASNGAKTNERVQAHIDEHVQDLETTFQNTDARHRRRPVLISKYSKWLADVTGSPVNDWQADTLARLGQLKPEDRAYAMKQLEQLTVAKSDVESKDAQRSLEDELDASELMEHVATLAEQRSRLERREAQLMENMETMVVQRGKLDDRLWSFSRNTGFYLQGAAKTNYFAAKEAFEHDHESDDEAWKKITDWREEQKNFKGGYGSLSDTRASQRKVFDWFRNQERDRVTQFREMQNMLRAATVRQGTAAGSRQVFTQLNEVDDRLIELRLQLVDVESELHEMPLPRRQQAAMEWRSRYKMDGKPQTPSPAVEMQRRAAARKGQEDQDAAAA